MQIESGDMTDFRKDDRDKQNPVKTMKFGKGEQLEYNICQNTFEKW